jgi:hypothetical protein
LTELWSDRLTASLIAKAPELNFGQEVLHGYLKRLYSDLGHMHTLTLKTKDDVEFQIGLIVQLNPREFLV